MFKMYHMGWLSDGVTCFVHFLPYNHQYPVWLSGCCSAFAMMSYLSMNSLLNVIKTVVLRGVCALFHSESLRHWVSQGLFHSPRSRQSFDHGGWFCSIKKLVINLTAPLHFQVTFNQLSTLGLKDCCRNSLLTEAPDDLSLRFLFWSLTWSLYQAGKSWIFNVKNFLKVQYIMLTFDQRKPIYMCECCNSTGCFFFLDKSQLR